MISTVTINRDEGSVWVVECPSIPGCFSQDDTKAEALVNIEESIRACLEARAANGMPLTVETHQVEIPVCCRNLQACRAETWFGSLKN